MLINLQGWKIDIKYTFKSRNIKKSTERNKNNHASQAVLMLRELGVVLFIYFILSLFLSVSPPPRAQGQEGVRRSSLCPGEGARHT